MSHQKINCQILQRSENNLFCYREITDNNAYSIYNKQKFVCLVQKKKIILTINRRQD